jgi:hypothetical protein
VTIKSELIGTTLDGTLSAIGITERDGQVGLNTFSAKLNLDDQRSILFINSEKGRSMVQDASASGATLLINNGGDAVGFTGSNITGTNVDFASAVRVITGAASIEVANPKLNDIWEFDAGGSTSLSAYDAITGNINIDKDWGIGDSVSVYGWDGATVVGQAVLLENYINQTDFDLTQAFSIPFEDMGLNGTPITALRMQQVGKIGGKTATFYLDDLYFSEAATLQYIAQPSSGQTVTFDRLELSVANNITTLSYDDFMGLTLTSGFTLQRFEGNDPQIAIQYRTISDLLTLTWDIAENFNDGVNTFVKLRADLPEPSILDGPRGDKLVITLSDDFSSLLLMNAILIGKEVVNGN